jgi:hypothetical protein
MSYQEFALAIDRFIDEDVPESIGKFARLVAIAGLQKVILKSPVDTGRFRGGWLVTIASRTDAAPTKVEGVKSGKRGKSGRGAAAGSDAINAGLGVIAGARPFEAIVIQNNVEYGEALEDGSSDQAPRGMLSITLAELEQVFK